MQCSDVGVEYAVPWQRTYGSRRRRRWLISAGRGMPLSAGGLATQTEPPHFSGLPVAQIRWHRTISMPKDAAFTTTGAPMDCRTHLSHDGFSLACNASRCRSSCVFAVRHSTWPADAVNTSASSRADIARVNLGYAARPTDATRPPETAANQREPWSPRPKIRSSPFLPDSGGTRTCSASSGLRVPTTGVGTRVRRQNCPALGDSLRRRTAPRPDGPWRPRAGRACRP